MLNSFKDFISVTFAYDDQEYQAHKFILAVNIATAFSRRRGVSAFHRFIERGHLPRQWSLETDMKGFYFDHINSAMKSPLSFSTIWFQKCQNLWVKLQLSILYTSSLQFECWKMSQLYGITVINCPSADMFSQYLIFVT